MACVRRILIGSEMHGRVALKTCMQNNDDDGPVGRHIQGRLISVAHENDIIRTQNSSVDKKAKRAKV